MPVSLRNATGSLLPRTDAIINDLSILQSTKFSIHKLPGADKDLVQKMGASNRRFSMKGIAITYVGSTFLEVYCNNATGSLTFSNPLGAVLSTTTVLFHDLQWVDSGLRPLERRFTLDAVELI